MEEKKRFSRLRLAYLFLFTFYFGAWLIAQFGDDKNWVVALAGMGAEGTFLPFAAIALILLAIRRRWRDFGVCLSLFLFFTIVSGQFRVHPVAPNANGAPTVKVMSFNVNHGWHGVDKIARIIRTEDIDAFGFQECGLGNDNQAIEELKGLLPEYHFISDGSRTSGTRLPVVREKVIPLDNLPYSWTMIEQVVVKDGQEARILSVHSPSYLPETTCKRPFLEWFVRWGEVSIEQTALIDSELAKVGAETIPTILCGDLNMTPMSARYRKMATVGTDSFAAVGTGTGWTMPAGLPMRRIDYVWAFNGVRPLSSKVVDWRSSDHAAVVAELALR